MTPKAFHALFGRIGARAGMPFAVHPHMLRHGCGYALANAGHDTRGRRVSIMHRAVYQRDVDGAEARRDSRSNAAISSARCAGGQIELQSASTTSISLSAKPNRIAQTFSTRSWLVRRARSSLNFASAGLTILSSPAWPASWSA
jgi:hypothetical protein